MSDDTIYGQKRAAKPVPRIRPHQPAVETACDAWPPHAWVEFTRRLAQDPEFKALVVEAQDRRLERYHAILDDLVEQHVPLARGQYRELSAIAHRRALAEIPRPNPLED